jgi:hypothetical protein
MKNIHVIPTDKPSRLYSYKSIDLYLHSEIVDANSANLNCKNQNIYITSEEEIKDGDWMIRGNEQPTLVTPNFFWDFGVRYYKIILTTDQDLIKDGVQAIDDEFLEWFVKNPSCEDVELANSLVRISSFDWRTDYKIFIPKEEPKQETLEEVKDLTYYRANAEEDYLQVPISVLRYISELEERSYSEQETFNMLMEFWKEERPEFKTNPVCVSNWFEQNKKK